MEKSCLSNEELLKNTSHLVSEERRITAQLLEHLREIEQRRLHLQMGFGSMFELLTSHFHYSEGAASRRIAAMRLSKEVPSLVRSIETGKLSLSTASQVQHFLQNEKKSGRPYSAEQKMDLAVKMEGRSRRECERELLKLSPESVLPKEKERALTPTETEIRFIANERLMSKIEKLKGLLAHHGNLGYAELIEKLADQALKKLDPEQEPRRSASPPAELSADPDKPRETSTSSLTTKTPIQPARRPHISALDRRAIWQRAQGCCEYVDTKSGRRCSSHWALEIDHIKPLSQGGPHERSNFRLLCRQHNSWAAIQSLGLPLMSKYFSK